MTRLTMCCVVAVTLALGACATKEQSDTESAAADGATGEALAPSVALAAAVAQGVDENPTAADSVLAANGLTLAGLDSLMYTIAEDSALSAAYMRAVR